MSKKKIFWLAHEANVSGANLCLKEFMMVAAAEGYEQLLIIPHVGSMELIAKQLNIPTKIIHYYGWVKPLNGFGDKLIIRKFLRNIISILQITFLIIRYKPTVIFSNTSVISIGAWAGLITMKKHYWYLHEMGEENFGFKLPWGKIGYWFMNFASTKLLTNSFYLANKYRSKYKKIDIEVIRNPVLVKNRYDPIKWNYNEAIRLLLLGEISEIKGHLIAIEALGLLIKSGYKITLSIVGKCQDLVYLKRLIKKIEELGLEDYIEFSDYSEYPIKTIAMHHILLMCSKCESFGRVTIEAMKTGIAVAGSNTCGTKEIIENRLTGFLFEQGNSLSLYSTLKIIIEENELREKIILNAKQYAEQLTDKSQLVNLFLS